MRATLVLLRPLRPATLARSQFWYAFSRNKLAVIGLFVVSVFIILAVFANLIAPYPYDRGVLADAREVPSLKHWFGTDEVGRDILSRIIYGARTSLIAGFAVQGVGLLLGLALGSLAGFKGKIFDLVVLRLVEITTAVPLLLLALFLMSIMGAGLRNVIIALIVGSWVAYCRVTRAQSLAFKEREFVLAATALGASDWRIIVRHILPNIFPSLVVMMAYGIPSAIFAEAGLSFLGIGVNEPLPSWGKMVSTGLAFLRVQWHLAFFPTIMIALLTLAFTFVGDGFRDAMDPSLRRR